ncbi:MAG TPA: glycosyltransferase family 2 protein [Bryobacteraceae bacterium]|nr:glycosyltransferase family 2 protein [Bryobacteraceae bacterium]
MSGAAPEPEVSTVIVSFNTRDLLRECLHALEGESAGLETETIVVDNASRDGSADMVAREFPRVKLIRSEVNLGFAPANNVAFREARGRYVLLLNSDAFLGPGALTRAVRHMEEEPEVGLGGGKLVGRDGAWQPSARMFPSVLNEFLMLSGLAARFAGSRFFGRADRTWADPDQPADVDWVPGAFSLVRREALEKAGYFDENFYLYYEETDFCRRLKMAGYTVRYWPDVVVVHLGGESSRTVEGLSLSRHGSQLTLWRMRSQLLYYRKHHPRHARLIKCLEQGWHRLRAWKNELGHGPAEKEKAADSRRVVELMEQAWEDTRGGRFAPPRPW